MHTWWETISVFEKIFWYIAVPFSVILVIQMILTFAGMGGSDSDIGAGLPDSSGLDIHVGTGLDMPSHDIAMQPEHHDGGFVAEPHFAVFTIRNFIAFFTIFGWVGIAGARQGLSAFWTIIMALALGLLAMLVVSALFYFIYKLADSGNMMIENAIGKTGKVYLPIKANSANIGKIHVEFQGALREMQAVTKADEDLSTGQIAIVTGILSEQILIVEKA